MVEIRVLGPMEAEVAGVRAPLGGPRQRAVLALLVAARGEVVPVDRMIEDLWRGEPPGQAVASLQAYVSNLRKVLEPDRAPRAPARVLVSAAPGYALRLPEGAVDAWRFGVLVHDPERLGEALGLWRGAAFGEFADEEWAQAEIGRLDELRLVARERHVAGVLRAGDAAGAAVEAERLTRDEPFREEGWRLLATALWGAGRQADALAALLGARAVLADELGLDPGPALVELESAIIRQRTGPLDVPAPPLPEPPLPALEAELFLGRDGELAALTDLAAGGGGVRVALVTGEAGLGKTALLARVAGTLEREGWLVVTGRCPEGDGAPPAWAWTEALTALARHVPAPDGVAPLLDAAVAAGPRDTTAGRFRLHRAVWEWLNGAARRRPLAVMLDDLHWADGETLALLSAVTGDAPLLVVAAYRGEEVGERLTGVLAVLARRSPLRLPLRGLPGSAVARLVAAECADVDGATVDALAERTGGNPFYVRESARLLSSEGALVATSEVPEGVRDVLRRRLARLPEPAVAVLRLAALAGCAASVDVLVPAADIGEDGVLDALEAGLVAGLLREDAPGRVRFTHALVRDTMTADLSALRRARMHARLGAALERVDPADATALAFHFHHAASAATAGRAVEYAVRAAELAERRYAHDTAVGLLRQALESFERLPERDEGARVDLLGRLLRAQVRAGALREARATRQRALDVAAESAARGPARDDLLIAAFTAWTEPAPWLIRAYGAVDAGLVGLLERLLGRGDLTRDVRCRLLDAYAAELAGTGDARGRAAAEDAVALAREVGDPLLRAATLLTLGRELGRGEAGAAAALHRELREVGVEHGLPTVRWAGTFNLAGAAVLAGHPGQARALVGEAADLARRYRMPEPTAICEIAVAAFAHVEGRLDDAERHYAAAADLMAEQGNLHGPGFAWLARATLALSRGALADLAAEDGTFPPDFAPLAADVFAAAHAAAGDHDRARHRLESAPAGQPDFFFTTVHTFRAMAVVALGDTQRAAVLYEALLPYRDGPPAGLESLSIVLPPPARTLGELARVLGRDPAPHLARAAEITALWSGV